MPTGDFPDPKYFPADYPSSFSIQSTEPYLGVVCSTSQASWQPIVTGGTTTVSAPYTPTSVPNTGGATTYSYPYVVNTPFIGGGQVWASTSSNPFHQVEWTHRIWFNDKWTYYMQTSNEAEHILMNKRKIKQSCLLS